ncbi:interleukin-17 receptor B isoform X2 [Pipistrellus kuhlii]|uniref:interleukin-17 receptor B isoform X2 n=1 Tax=Pipistrellus kuhlii TaxID=59472 RepID=UPI00174F0F6A|nr:interleukin-17 receptor B isoform X2 [Pipistrellus kuhlii]
MSLVLLSLAALCQGALSQEPTIQCGSENGPSPEWLVRHTLTPGDLRDLRVEPVVTKSSSILMNISWILRADASIRFLKATKICVSGKSNVQFYDCVRCNYTEAFQTQTRPAGGKWTFSYIGFSVELNTQYFIGAHNIPNANMNDDSPSLSVDFTSPGCLDHLMKYKTQCIQAGSLWDPNITACKKDEKTVEVNFTTSPLGNRYMAFIQTETVIGSSVLESKLTHVSVMVPVTEESEGAVVQLTPYFRTCGNDCIRRKGTVVLCPQTDMSFPLDNKRISTSFPTTTLLPPIKVLVVYPPEICFHHTVCYFTEFLQNHCRSEVILDKWQRKKIAEMGLVQWLTTQKQAAEKVVFLLSNDVNPGCDGTCGKSKGSLHENSQDLFPLAFNLFCSDLRSQTHLHKYLVVYFREADTKDDYNALSVCPRYYLMKDAATFCVELLRAERHALAGKRLPACHSLSSV